MIFVLAACSPQASPNTVDTAAEAALAGMVADAPPAEPAPGAPPVAVMSAGDAPPTVDGIFIDGGACPGEGCYLEGKIKAREPAALYQHASNVAPAIATIEAEEWVEILGTEDRLIPVPGKVRATGETVYRLGYEGEGCSTVWNKGQLSTWCDDDGDLSNDAIVWEEPPASSDPSLGFWVQVRRANGQTGWLADDSNGSFACTGYQDRDDDCPPLPQ